MTDSEAAAALTAFSTWWRRTAPNAGLPTSSLSTLDLLDRHGPLRVSDLAARERLSQPGMTNLITRLEGDGLVERFADDRDGRVALVRLTALGATRLGDLRADRARLLRDRIAALPGADQDLLAAAAPALRRLFDTSTQPEGATR